MGNAGIFNDGTHACQYVTVTAGEDVVLGNVLAFKQSGESGADNKAFKCPTGGNTYEFPCGIALENASANNPVRMAVSGICKVLPESTAASNYGYVIVASVTTAGTALQAATTPASAVHFREIGHWVTDGATGAANYAVIHFN